MDVVSTVVPESYLEQLRDQLPRGEDDENWRELFGVVDAGEAE